MRHLLIAIVAASLAGCGGSPTPESACTSPKGASAYIGAIQARFLADAKNGKVSAKRLNAYLELVAGAAEQSNASKDYVKLCRTVAAKLSEFGYGPKAD